MELLAFIRSSFHSWIYVEHWSFDLMYEDSFLKGDAGISNGREKIATIATMTAEANALWD
jgi:hypothetical protein